MVEARIRGTGQSRTRLASRAPAGGSTGRVGGRPLRPYRHFQRWPKVFFRIVRGFAWQVPFTSGSVAAMAADPSLELAGGRSARTSTRVGEGVPGRLQLEGGWDEQAVRLEHPFLTSAWLQAWWDAFAPADAVPLRDVSGAGKLLSTWPIYARRGGRDLCGLANVHTPISGRLRPLRPISSESLVPPSAGRILWPALNHHEAVALTEILEPAGWIATVEPQRRSPIVEMDADQAAYARTRGRSLRQRAGRLERKLVREHDAQFRLVEPDPEHGLHRACVELEAAGWKGRNRTAILSDPGTAQFYDAVAGMPAARLSAITVPSGPIAFALCLLHDRRLYLLKTGYDERYRQLSPGLVLQWSIINHCHHLGLEAYELLGSADPWKLQLATADRAISRLVAHKDTPAGRARAGVRRLRPLAKNLHGRLTPPTRHG